MDTNSKKLQDNFLKFRKFKKIILAILVILLIGMVLINSTYMHLLVLLALLVYLNSKKLVNEIKLLLLHQQIREMVVVDKSVYQILEESSEKSQLNIILGKKYKKMIKHLNAVEEYIYKSTLKGKQSEAMIDRVIVDVARNLVNPIDEIGRNIDKLKENNYDLETIDNMEEEVYELKNTINELFELSKATTNTMELNIEKLEINALIKQSLVEYETKFGELNLKSKKIFKDEKTYVNADGEKLWRVFEIILDNVLKYSKENTRVYIKSESVEGKVIVSIINISKEELNVSVDEFNENINKNSCLGLAIASGLMSIQKSNLSLDIDGDMFRVNLEFDIIKEDGERGED